jgi:dipeptidyl aminopeptidase/acylaminoacyl peptidase
MRRAKRKRGVTPEDLLKMKVVTAVAISPDGERIVYVVEEIDEDENTYYSHLWMVDASGGEPHRYTWGNVRDRTPCWSPDGNHIAFLSTRDHEDGIYVMRTDGGEARRLTEQKGVFHSLSWSPDGTSLLCSFREMEKRSEEEKEKQKTGKAVQPVVREIGRLMYKMDGEGFRTKNRFHLWLFDVETGEGKQITRGRYDDMHGSFSPSGRTIAFVSNRSRDVDRHLEEDDLWVIPAKGGKARRLEIPKGPKGLICWSPNGRHIAYVGHDRPGKGWGVVNYHIWVVPTRGRGKAMDLTPDYDRTAIDLTISDTREGLEPSVPTWSENGEEIFYTASDRGSTHLYRVSSSGGNPSKLFDFPCEVMGFSFSHKRDKVAMPLADPLAPGDVWLLRSKGRGWGEPTRLTQVNRKLFSERVLSRPQEVTCRSHDGTEIHGWIMKPINWKRGRRYPAVVEIHGGPRVQYGNTYFHEFQVLVAAGYVVLYLNPRGSQGYGEEFADALTGKWGEADYPDIMAGVDALLKRGYVDHQRLGVTGGSYGGFMTNWIIGHTDRFRAAVTQRSVVNMVSMFGSSDGGYEMNREFNSYPWDGTDLYRRLSPLTYVKEIRTPLLIIHSEQDLRCSIEQAEQLFCALKVLRRRVEFIRFPEEPHGLSRHGRPDRRVERLKRIVGWFDTYLKGKG